MEKHVENSLQVGPSRDSPFLFHVVSNHYPCCDMLRWFLPTGITGVEFFHQPIASLNCKLSHLEHGGHHFSVSGGVARSANLPFKSPVIVFFIAKTSSRDFPSLSILFKATTMSWFCSKDAPFTATCQGFKSSRGPQTINNLSHQFKSNPTYPNQSPQIKGAPNYNNSRRGHKYQPKGTTTISTVQGSRDAQVNAHLQHLVLFPISLLRSNG